MKKFAVGKAAIEQNGKCGPCTLQGGNRMGKVKVLHILFLENII